MLGATVRHSVSPWVIGGVVEKQHPNHSTIWGVRAKDGHMYWVDACQIRIVCKDLFSNMEHVW